MCYEKIMLKKALNIFISILLLLPLLTGTVGFSQPVDNNSPSFQKPCDMNDCNPYAPKCPLCPSSGSVNLYLNHEAGAYLPILACSFILDSVSTLSDQGVIKAIFHPPTATS
jgi:hypothetical protein